MEFPNRVSVPNPDSARRPGGRRGQRRDLDRRPARWWMRLPVIPYQPRRPAPWRGVHVLSALVVYLALAQVGVAAIHHAGFAEAAPARAPRAAASTLLQNARRRPRQSLAPADGILHGGARGADRRGDVLPRPAARLARRRRAARATILADLARLARRRPDRPQLDPLRRRPLPRVGDRFAADGHRDCQRGQRNLRTGGHRFHSRLSAQPSRRHGGRLRLGPGETRRRLRVWDCWRPWRRCRRSTWRRCC